MRILQIAPVIGPGSGVAGVAWHLEQEWQRRGLETARFTMAEARGAWIPDGLPGARGKMAHLLRVVWFSTVGTWLVRRHLRRVPDTVSVCHNDALAGDVYVNHGILEAAMRARGHYLLRMARNPLHLFTWLRDRRRYGPRGPHRLIVNLTATDDRLLHELHPRLATPTAVIGNGIDVGRFSPPSPEQRQTARRSLTLEDTDVVVLFVGHEFDRKGLPLLLDALAELPDHHKLLVVGGTPEMVRRVRARARAMGLGERVRLVGRTGDARPYLHAANMLALPSAYEAYPLVVLEALACDLPVVATATGSVPDLIKDGHNGFVVHRSSSEIASAIARLAEQLGEQVRGAARATAEQHSWSAVAEDYRQVLTSLRDRETTVRR